MARLQTPSHEFTFAAILYAMFIAYPLLLGARAKRRFEPYLAAVLASVPFFFFARDAMVDAGLDWGIGILPVGQAILMMILVLRLLGIEQPSQRQLTRLATVAAAALAFITLAIPLQLDKQWITLAWALEGAALVWLFTRIPHRGLLVWATGLLSIVFVRLVLNPEVFSYHPASHLPVLNWYLYTYLVSAIAFFLAAYFWPRDVRAGMAAANVGGTIILFVLLNIEIADFYSKGPNLAFNFFSSSLAQDLTYTIGWAVFAVAMLIAGIAFHTRSARVAALLLLVVTILKCFLHDLARLGGLYRVGSLLGLAMSLVLVGILLQKFVMSKRPGFGARGGGLKRSVMALALIAASALAQPQSFQHERTVTPGSKGANRLDVDVPLLAGSSPDLHDVRLIDATPASSAISLIRPQSREPEWRRATLLAVASTKTTSGFEADLGALRDVDRIRFAGVRPPYLKHVTLEGSGDRSHWTMLADTTVFDLPDQRLRRPEIAFAPGEYRYLRMTWDDRSSARASGVATAEARLHDMIAPPDPLRAPLPFRKLSSEPGKSRYRIDLPGPNLPVDAVEVQVSGGDVFRASRVTEPQLANGAITPVVLGTAQLRRAVREGFVAAEMGVPITAPTGRELEIVVDDGANAPLPVSSIVARFSAQPWIYFESPDGAPITARYGNQRVLRPQYDLEAARQFVGRSEIAAARWSNR